MHGLGTLIFTNGERFLGQFCGNKIHGEGTWTLPGESMHYHEPFEDCATREVKEETNLEIKIKKLSHEFLFIYFFY